MFKQLIFFAVVAVACAKPGLLAPSLSIAAAPAIVSAPSVGLVRTAPIAPIALGSPLALNGGLISSGLVTGGLLNNELVSTRLVPGGLVSGGLISSHVGLIR